MWNALFLGDAVTGVIEMPLASGVLSGQVTLDALYGEDIIDINIANEELSPTQKNALKGAEYKKILVLTDTENQANAHATKVFILEKSARGADGITRLRGVGMGAYLSMRIASFQKLGAGTELGDADAVIEFSGSNNLELAKDVVRLAFTQPTGVTPNVPSWVSTQSRASGNNKVEIGVLEAISFADIFHSIGDESRAQYELKFKIALDSNFENVTATTSVITSNYDSTPTEINVTEEDIISFTGDSAVSSAPYSRVAVETALHGDDARETNLRAYNTSSSALLVEAYNSLSSEVLSNSELGAYGNSLLTSAVANGVLNFDSRMAGDPLPLIDKYLGKMFTFTGANVEEIVETSKYRVHAAEITLGESAVQIYGSTEENPGRLPNRKTVPAAATPNKNVRNTNRNGDTNASMGGSPVTMAQMKNYVAQHGGGGGTTPLPPNPWEPGNPEDPGDGGPGASWGINAGGPANETPNFNLNTTTWREITTFEGLIWGNSQKVIQNEGNFVFSLHGFPEFGPVNYAFAEAPTAPTLINIGETDVPSVVYSAYMSEGTIKDQKKIGESFPFTAAHLQNYAQQAHNNNLWARPEPVWIPGGANPVTQPGNTSYYYIQSMVVKVQPRFAISTGGRIIIPINWNITWRRDNATINGNTPTGWNTSQSAWTSSIFTTFVAASPMGRDILGAWSNMDFFGQTGTIDQMGRVGMFGVYTTAEDPLVIRSINFGAGSGLQESQWVSVPLPEGYNGTAFGFGYINNFLSLFSLRSTTGVNNFEIAWTPVSGSAPIMTNTSWNITPSVWEDGVDIVSQGRDSGARVLGGGAQFNNTTGGKPIMFGSSGSGSARNYRRLLVLDGEFQGRQAINTALTANAYGPAGILSFRNYSYILTDSGHYWSFLMEYAPDP